MTDYQIKPLDLQDAAAAQQLIEQLWVESDQFTIADEEETSELEAVDAQQDPAQTWLLHVDTESGTIPVGLASVARGEVGLAVLAAYQGQQYAQALLTHAIDWAKVSGVKKLWLDVLADNQVARHIYDKFGFEPVGQQNGTDQKTLIRMELPL